MKIKIIVFLLLVIIFSINSKIINNNQGIVILKKANVYEKPDKSSAVITTINKDEIFIIDQIKKKY